MNDIDVIFKYIRAPPVYINALVLCNGKSLPTFVNHTFFIPCSRGIFKPKAKLIISRINKSLQIPCRDRTPKWLSITDDATLYACWCSLPNLVVY